MADQNQAVNREFDEDVRREQLFKLWEKYGIYVLGLAALIVIGVLGYKYWEGSVRSAAEASGQKFADALSILESKPADAKAQFEALAKAGNKGYAALASFELAAKARDEDKDADALTIYETLGKDASIDPVLRDLARLKAAEIRLASADYPEMQSRLADLMKEGNPWRYMARELQGLAALKAGNLNEARITFQQLAADRKVPQSIEQRAQVAMARVIELELVAKAQPIPTAPTPPAAPAPAVAQGAAPSAPAAAPPPPQPKKR